MKGVWIAVAVVFAILCGVLGFLLANRRPVYPVAHQSRLGAQDLEEVIESFNKVDPKQVICKESARLSPGFKELRGVAVGPEDRIYAAGDKALVVMDPEGKVLSRVSLDKAPTCVGVGSDGTAFVGMMDHIEVFDDKGARTAVWEKPGPKPWITSVAVTGADVYAADFGDKTVIHYDRSGKIQRHLGEPGAVPGTGKYEIPSPYFDVAVDPSGRPWVAHTGRRVLERYKDDGSLAAFWGEQGPQIEKFNGCCNPSHFAIRKDGSFITSEKGYVRVKIYGPTGKLEGVVAGPKDFEKGIHGLDLAVDSKDRILVVDPGTSTIRVYGMKPSESNP